jgi:ATPase subunit of ABC transporter with duplicated ATPase domains
MLTVNRFSKTYADNVILKDVSFIVNAGERAGLVGPNGCGKTTLLRLVTGQEAADSGSVQMAASAGYLAQGFAAPPGATLQSCLNVALGDLAQAEADVERLAAALAHSPEAMQEYDAALARLQTLSARADAGRAPATLAHFGFDGVPLTTPVAALSGGQKTRLGLALLLLSDPQLLLLDEPTNHLDLDMLIWLEGWLAAFRGGALIVSHDRAFLDRTVSSILELDPASHTVRQYPGNYSDYIEVKPVLC